MTGRDRNGRGRRRHRLGPDYLGQRRLTSEIRDLYGQLIDGMQGTRGQIRTGGDSAGAGKQEREGHKDEGKSDGFEHWRLPDMKKPAGPRPSGRNSELHLCRLFTICSPTSQAFFC